MNEALGTATFMALEHPEQMRRFVSYADASRRVDGAFRYSADEFWNASKCEDRSTFERKVERRLENVTRFILSEVDVEADGDLKRLWNDTTNAFLFALSVATTIGFGGLTPRTTLARLFIVPYLIASLIVVGMFFHRLSIALERLVLYGYSRFACRWFRSRRKESENPYYAERKRKRNRLIDETVGEEKWKKTDSTSLAVPLVFGIGERLNPILYVIVSYACD